MSFVRIVLLMLITTIGISGCFIPYRPDIEQGNYIPNDVSQVVRPGMTRQQVESNLGRPVLDDIFAGNEEMVYVYTYQKGHKKIKRHTLIIRLMNGRVVNYTLRH